LCVAPRGLCLRAARSVGTVAGPREISAQPAERSHVNVNGRPFAAMSVLAMSASKQVAQRGGTEQGEAHGAGG